MKKAMALAVLASMMVSANVAFAGLGLPKAPKAAKPAAASSQQSAAVDVASLVNSCEPVTVALNLALAKVLDAQNVFDELIGKVSPESLELLKSLQDTKQASEKKFKAAKQAGSVLAKLAGKKNTTPDELVKANVEQSKVDAAFTTAKTHVQESYKLAGAAITAAPKLLSDATGALKSLTPTDSNFGKIKSVIDVCKLAVDYTKTVGAYEKNLGMYKDYKTKKK